MKKKILLSKVRYFINYKQFDVLEMLIFIKVDFLSLFLLVFEFRFFLKIFFIYLFVVLSRNKFTKKNIVEMALSLPAFL